MYITTKLLPSMKQITVDDILAGEITDFSKYGQINTNYPTRTLKVADFSGQPQNLDLQLFYSLELFNKMYAGLENTDTSGFYRSFAIPKASGGFRPIDAPNEELRKAHNDLKDLLSRFTKGYHTAAYAYVKNRNPKLAVKQHQANNSNWCLRTDFSNFFGSSTPEFVYKMLSIQFPFACMCASERGRQVLKDALSLCFLRGGLPQGSTISPFLTNLMMIPFDYELSRKLDKKSFVYTRYADDIQISHYSKFDPNEIIGIIDGLLEEFEAPFRIKKEKTKFSSCAGINYMLGLDYNANHDITVGHKAKRTFKAMVNNFLRDWTYRKYWKVQDTQYMRGLLSYYTSIEKDYFEFCIKRLEEKYHLDFYACVKKILKGEICR